MGAVATLTQALFIGRNDDGTQVTATQKATKNGNWTQTPNAPFRIRFCVQCTVAGDNHIHIAQYNLNGAGWVTITTSSSVVKAVPSAFVADGIPTTQQIGSGTFRAGEVSTDGATATISMLVNEETEVEYVCQIVGSDVVNGDSIQLRGALNLGAAYNVYSQTPTVTVQSSIPAATKSLLRSSVNIAKPTPTPLGVPSRARTKARTSGPGRGYGGGKPNRT